MRVLVSAIFACCIIALLLVAGCADVNVQKKALDFGTAFGSSSEEQKAIDWFKDKYGDPIGNTGPARFVEPLITSGLTDKRLPVDKVTTFPVSGGSVYFFVIYDNFNKGDPITVTWTYLENGKEITNIQQQAGGDFGRFIAEIQKPDSGWGRGKQRITITGDGVTASVNFTIGDTLQTTSLPYTAGSTGTGLSHVTPAGPKTTLNQGITGNPRLPQGASGGVTTTLTTAVTTAAGLQPAAGTTSSVDLKSDPRNCGKEGNVCPVPPFAKASCVNGNCRFYCYDFVHYSCSYDATIGCNILLMEDHNNCGACGKKCQGSEQCQDGNCVSRCVYGLTSCGYSCVDLKTNINNCGSCGHVCPSYPHAMAKCVDKQCNMHSGGNIICTGTWGDCDGIVSNGCEKYLIDYENCGACMHSCHTGLEDCRYDPMNPDDLSKVHCAV